MIGYRRYVDANSLSTLRTLIETTNYFKDLFYNYSLHKCNNFAYFPRPITNNLKINFSFP